MLTRRGLAGRTGCYVLRRYWRVLMRRRAARDTAATAAAVCYRHVPDPAMRRREFVALIGGAAAWPFAARAQGQVPTVGFLRSTTEKGSEYLVTAFRQGLRQ